MRIVIVCGNEDCREEYYGDTMDKEWKCPRCSRVKENMYWPFLNARLMQAKIDKDTNWQEMFDEIIMRARAIIEKKDAEINQLKKRIKELEKELENE